MKSEPLLSLEYNAERGDDGRKKIRDANQIAAMIMLQWVGSIFEGFDLFLCTLYTTEGPRLILILGLRYSKFSLGAIFILRKGVLRLF